MMSVAIFAQERVEQRQKWDATVRQYGLAETTIVPDGVTPIPIRTVEELSDLVYELSLDPIGEVEAVSSQVLGVMTLHSIGDVQLNNNIKDSGRRLEMRLNFNVYVGIDRLGYTIPARAKCNHRV